MDELGAKIRRERTNLGLTQQELADRLGVTYSSVSHWEAGTSTPRVPILKSLADMFKTTVAELIGERVQTNIMTGGVMVPVLGTTHMGECEDEEPCLYEVEVPSRVVEAHPQAFAVHAQGGCMDNRYPSDSVLLVDPAMQPYSGCAVLAETADYRSVVRVYSRGNSTVMLAADSHSGEYEDIVSVGEDEPVTVKGVVVWYQAEKDVRRS